MKLHRIISVFLNAFFRYSPTLQIRLQTVIAMVVIVGCFAGMVQAQCLSWVPGFGPAANGLNGTVYCMTQFDEDGPGGNPPSLFVGGSFTTAGGLAVNGLARWNGMAWSAVSGGVTGGGASVRSLAVANDGSGPALFVGGSFTSAGGVGANNIAKWNGTSWSALGTGTAGNGGWVHSIAQYNGYVYAGGDFTSAGGVTLNYIARWNGASWSALGATVGTSGGVYALTVYNGDLIVGGAFPSAGMVLANFIAKWNGAAWSTLGPIATNGVNSTVRALLLDGGSLYVGGNFTSAGGAPANRVAKWNGTAFSALGAGTDGAVRSLAAFDDECGHAIYVGGEFLHAGGVANSFIARYVGGVWKGVSGGTISWVRALAPYYFQSLASLYAGGDFAAAGGVPSQNFAKYQANDMDGDGIFDCWESVGQGIDVNCDGVIDLDLFALGARPDHKDIFVELDAMGGLAPGIVAMANVVTAFDAAPVANPDGLPGIKLHIELDELALPGMVWPAFLNGWPTGFDLYKLAAPSGTVLPGYFGSIAQRNNANGINILTAKRMVYRYCMFAVNCQPPPSTTSGLAEVGGNDFMVSLAGWTVPGGTPAQQAGTFMHELGHTLGLYHGGNQVTFGNDARYNYKPNYHSVMNYTWQTPRPAYAGGWVLNYSDGAKPPLFEGGLFEALGIGGLIPGVMVPIGPPSWTLAPEAGPVNWDRIFPFPNPMPVIMDINHLNPSDPASPGDVLTDNDDWHGLDYNFRDNGGYADGTHDEITDSELTLDIDTMLSVVPGVPCAADINGDHVVNTADLLMVISAWGACPIVCPADINGDGVVNTADLLAVISGWGPCP